MSNIKQKYHKFIISLLFIISFSSCQSTQQTNINQNEADKIVEVAILMPLSGDKKELGSEYVSLVTRGIKDGLNGQINLTIYDGATEKLAAEALDKMIAKNTKIILGPLTSDITSYIAPRVKAHGIIMITLSNNPVLADEKLIVFGHAPLKQFLPLTNYFLDNHYSHFITLLPAGTHFSNVNQVIQNLIVKKHAMLMRAEFYAPNPDSIERAVKNVSDSITNLNDEKVNSLPPVIIVAGEDYRALSLLFNSIRNHNLDQKAIIAGDNKLDFYYPNDINLIFTGSLNALNSGIKNKALEENISHITFMHALAYDLGKITATFIGEEFNEKVFLSRLNARLGYVGVSGKINFIDGIATREYDIINRINNNYETLWSKRQQYITSE